MRIIAASCLALLSGEAHAADPLCASGLAQHSPPRLGDACCPATCGQCGGPGCGSQPGGSSACCSSEVLSGQASCSTHDPPCVIDGFGPDADPNCNTGIAPHDPPRMGDVCCAESCGQCGGSGCSGLPGGSAACCGGAILKANVSCSTSKPPCTVTDLVPTPPPPAPKVVTLQADLSSDAGSVAPEYVSFTIDTSQLHHHDFAWHDSTIDLLISSLTPAHLRVGGTQADYEVYAIGDAASQTCEDLPSEMTSFRCKVFTEVMWTDLLDLAARNNVSLVFGLNDMFGRPTKTLKPEPKLCSESSGCPERNQTNLEALLKWTAENRPDAPIYAFELGNELNSCLNGEAGAVAQAEDFKALKQLRDRYWPSGQRMKLIGPDTHSAAEFQSAGLAWWETFVQHAAGTVDSFTFHMYSMGTGPKLDPTNLAFLQPAALDKSREGAEALMKIMQAQGNPGALWGGETSSANSGGQSGITDTFINGFWYLDQLGSHAAVGVQVFERQTFMSSAGYPMVNDTTRTPLPDYWTALLHKRLMGQTVLHVTSDSSMLRAYAHCSRSGRGGVMLALLNLAEHDVSIQLGGGLASRREEWLLQAGAPFDGAPNKLMSRDVLLNGKRLALLDGPSLPSLEGRTAGSDEALVVPATSYGFVHLPEASAAACTGEVESSGERGSIVV